VKTPWYSSPYTGLLSRCQAVLRRAHDPAVHVWAGTLPGWGPQGEDLATGGAGWTAAAAEAACVGEAVERWCSRPAAEDEIIEAAYADWPLSEPAAAPMSWVLFHPQQYTLPDFPFTPLTPTLRARWVCCRQAGTGLPWWVPEEMVFLHPGGGRSHQLWPGQSTGLACGRHTDPVLLRGLQEVIERDALVGAWWDVYPLEEHPFEKALACLSPEVAERLRRPNLRYRCYRIVSPWSDHVTLVSLEGEDHEGYCFSTGSACRETQPASWDKSLLEAVQGRHFVRFLRRQTRASPASPIPVDFAGHALYYSLHSEHLAATVLGVRRCRAAWFWEGEAPAEPHSARGATGLSRSLALPQNACDGPLEGAQPAPMHAQEGQFESVPLLAQRLGPDRPVLFRSLTPPALAAAGIDLVVLRVLVPGLQPLHGHHGYPYLGGPLWDRRPVDDWQQMPPHPFA
jgi:thiazole/oxazole-forming peptide maturase SagD family component